MAKKDIAGKLLEDYPEVFADIMNVLVFEKDDYIQPEELQAGPTESVYKQEHKTAYATQYRDICKRYIKGNMLLSVLGLENQTTEDADMAFRVMGYDYASYRRQISAGCSRVPVVTAVLYFGNTKWKAPRSVRTCFDEMPEEIKRKVSDYKIHVIDVAYLSRKVRSRLKSDFKIVADYFSETRKNKNYHPPKEEIKHVEAVLYFMKAFTNDERFVEIKDELLGMQEEGGRVTMCEVLDRVENRGIRTGRKQGMHTMNQMVQLLLKDGRVEELQRAVQDATYQKKLLRELGLLQ